LAMNLSRTGPRKRQDYSVQRRSKVKTGTAFRALFRRLRDAGCVRPTNVTETRMAIRQKRRNRTCVRRRSEQVAAVRAQPSFGRAPLRAHLADTPPEPRGVVLMLEVHELVEHHVVGHL